MSGIAHCIKKCLSQSDRCERIKHIKSCCKRGMTELTSRTEDVQVFNGISSPEPAGVGRAGPGRGGEEGSRRSRQELFSQSGSGKSRDAGGAVLISSLVDCGLQA